MDSKGCNAGLSPPADDQDSTDLQKCVQYVRDQAAARQLALRDLTLVALGALCVYVYVGIMVLMVCICVGGHEARVCVCEKKLVFVCEKGVGVGGWGVL